MEVSHIFDPQSPLAKAIADLFSTTLIISAVILALVTALVVYCLIQFRERPGQAEPPPQIHGHQRLEILWTVIPFLLLVVLFGLTVRVMKASDPAKEDREPDIIVIGHQFWWEIHYPRSGVVTANEIHVPVGARLLVRLGTGDVIHNFWVPQMGRKMDMIPDRANALWLQANEPGIFHGACAEFCGAQHAWMRILIVAEPPEEFAAWEQRQLMPTPPPATAAAQRGADLLRDLTCISCHAVDAQTAHIQAGPDLRHVISRLTLGAGVMPNTPGNLARWIRNPQAVKPGNLMPTMHLTDAQVSDILSYFGVSE